MFLLRSGEVVGAFRHIGRDEQDRLRIELIGEEAVETSRIEGEILNRESVQASLRHQFGLGPDQPGIPPAERGIAKMMVDLYEHFGRVLADESLVRLARHAHERRYFDQDDRRLSHA